MAAALQSGSSGRQSGSGQRKDARRPEVEHQEVCSGGVSPRHAAPQQSPGRPEQRHERQRLSARFTRSRRTEHTLILSNLELKRFGTGVKDWHVRCVFNVRCDCRYTVLYLTLQPVLQIHLCLRRQK